MLVTFHSKAWSSVTLFGDVAAQMLKMMGHSGTVPSALLAADIPGAIARLKAGLAAAGAAEASAPEAAAANDDADDAPPVSLANRAYPLLQLLTAAARQDCDVMWEEGGPPI